MLFFVFKLPECQLTLNTCHTTEVASNEKVHKLVSSQMVPLPAHNPVVTTVVPSTPPSQPPAVCPPVVFMGTQVPKGALMFVVPQPVVQNPKPPVVSPNGTRLSPIAPAPGFSPSSAKVTPQIDSSRIRSHICIQSARWSSHCPTLV